MLDNMLLAASTLLCLLAVNSANAFPALHDDALVSAASTLPTVASEEASVASEQLAELAKFAVSNTKASLDANNKQKRGLCTSSNLSIRREWYNI